jgi:HPt (histidine-containing phosphotransfer) domain-containing protein
MEEDHDHEESLGARLIQAARLNEYSASLELAFPKPLSQEEVSDLLTDLAEALAGSCMEAGAGMVGHIKGRFVTGMGVMRVHLVDPRRGAETFGELQGSVSGGTLGLLTVIQGLEEEVLERVCGEVVQRVLGEYL